MRQRRVGLLTVVAVAIGLLISTPALAESIRITASRLTVRKGPGKSFPRIGAAPKGRVYALLERKGPWLKIRFGRKAGWIHGRYTRSTVGMAPPEARPAVGSATHTVLPNRLNVRRSPARKAAVRFKLRRGTRVAVVETRGEWVKVSHRGRSGWTVSRFLTTGKLPPSMRPAPRRRPRRRPGARRR